MKQAIQIGIAILIAVSLISTGVLYAINQNIKNQSLAEQALLTPTPQATPTPINIEKPAQSTRNLSGLLLQINQIDTCNSPNLEIYTTVTNQNAQSLTNVRSTDFRVFEDDKEIKNFEFTRLDQNQVPISVVLVIDKSLSMQGNPLAQAKIAANRFIDTLNSDDRVALITFNSRVQVLHSLTEDKTQVKQSISQISALGDTALYDAVGEAVKQSMDCGRKAIIFLSDGADNSSKSFDLINALESANTKSIPVFTVGLVGENFNEQTLIDISNGSGAQYFGTTDPSQLAGLYRTIQNQINAQQLFKFNTTNTSGKHRIRIVSNIDGSDTSSEKTYRLDM